MKIRITYCWECGYGDQAVALAGKILADSEESIESLTLIPGADAVFDIEVGDQLVFSRHKTGRFPEFADIAPALG